MKIGRNTMNFTFMTASHIIFGVGVRNTYFDTILSLGDRPFVVTGSAKPEVESFLENIKNLSSAAVFFQASGEPSIPLIHRALAKARDNECNFVISIGGGSIIDTGKAVAALLTNGDNCLEFLEVIGQGKRLHHEPAPFVAVPTTAGTGSEVTKNAVISSPEHNVKVSLRSDTMIPNYAVIDPELCVSVPPDVTAWTGLDALTQLLEAYLTRKRNPLTDGICREGLIRASRSIYRAYTDGGDIDARTDMSCASLFSGLALANAGLGAVHGFAGPMGGMFNISHGLICASLLPHVFVTNIEAAMTLAEPEDLMDRFDKLAEILTGSEDAKKEDAVNWISETSKKLNIPGLSDLGIKQRDFPQIIQKAKNSSSMKGNPLELSDRELLRILELAF